MEIVGPSPDREAPLTIRGSPGLARLLERFATAIAVTTYRDGVVAVIGARDGRLVTRQRYYGHASALATGPDGVLVAGAGAIHGPGGSMPIGADHDVHALAADDDGGLHFCSTRRSCVATVDGSGGWTPLWRPAFISGIEPEDRCHLNGFSMAGSSVEAATALGATDRPGGWRERLEGGIVMDGSGAVVVEGLWLPHSPTRIGDHLWIAESGTGTVGVIDGGGYRPVAELAGFTRGIARLGDLLVVGLSMPWRARTPLPLMDRLRERRTAPLCGFAIIDLDGRELATCSVEAPRGEVLDVAVLGVPRGTPVG